MAEALYRKYRPQVFDDIVGQEHIERTIKNAIANGKVSHAYLFCGPRGTGKTTTARLLAKALLCEKGPTENPDGTCRECDEIANGIHPDVYELDAASRTGVDNVREEIISCVNFAPTRGKQKVYIIDEVHMLSTQAFNALLKTLEEPPEHVVFILCTTDPQKVPETIQSRCQRFDFHRISTEEIVSRLGTVCVQEGVEFEPDALDLIAHRAEGGMRNALTSLEQLISFGQGAVTVEGAEDLLGSLDSTDMAEIVRAIGMRDIAACFNWTSQYMETGADLAQFANDLAERVRNMYVLSLTGTDATPDIPDAERRQISEELEMFGPDRLARMLGVLGELLNQLRTSTNPRLCFEVALTRLVRPDSDLTIEALAERIEALESGLSATATVVRVPVQAPAAGMASAAAPVEAFDPAAPAESFDPGALDAETPGLADASAALQGEAAPAVQPLEAAVPASVPDAASGPAAAPAASVAGQPAAAPVSAPVPAPAPAPAEAAPFAEAAPAVEAEPVAMPSTATLPETLANRAALQRLWRSVSAALKKESLSYGALLVNVRVRPSANGDEVLIEFPADNLFAFQMVQKPNVQEAIQRAFAQVAGQPVPFTCVQGEATAAAASELPAVGAAPAAPAAPASAPVAAPASAAAPAAPAPAPAAAPAAPASAPASQAAPVGQAPVPAPAAEPMAAVHEPAPEPEGHVPASSPEPPEPELVPLDAYDGSAPDFDPPFVPDSPAPAAPATPVEPAAATTTAPASSEPADLGSLLSNAFGADIKIEEV